jgi:alanine racemase
VRQTINDGYTAKRIGERHLSPKTLLSAWAEVDLTAIAHNVRILKAMLKPPAQLMAVVKANAYGHGAVAVAQTTLQHGAEWLGVARVAEGAELRAAQIGAPILVLGPIAPAEAAEAVRARLSVAITSLGVARALSAQSEAQGAVTPVHLKIDTGMSRFGVPLDEAVATARTLDAMPALRLDGVFTHFASADEPDPTVAHEQVRRFQSALAALEQAGIAVPLRHAANSAGALCGPDFHFDMVRVGLALYGISPASWLPRAEQLRPALSLKSRVAFLRSLPPGTRVGYSGMYTAEHATGAALVSIGYADGVRRAQSNRGEVLIREKRARILGRVSMDQIVVDADACGAQEGDEVVLIGKQGEAEISVDEVAGWAQTISYEILTGIGARVPRIYKSG